MTKVEFLEALKALEEVEDVYYDYDEEDNTLSLDFNDWGGFGLDYEELDRDYANEELVYKVMDFLRSISSGDFYYEANVDGIQVTWGFDSYNI